MKNLPGWNEVRRRGIRGLLRDLLREHDAPARLSLAIGLGVLIGVLPFYGLQMWIGLGAAVLARLNKPAVFLGTQISLPWVAPLLIAGSVEIGWWIFYGRFAELSLSSLHPRHLPSYFLPWLVGSLVLGLALGAIAFGLSYIIVSRMRRRGESSPAR